MNTENYTKIPNKILEAAFSTQLNGTQFRILLTVCRYTHGFQRDECDLSTTFLLKALGLSQGQYKQVSRELKELFDMNILREVKEATKSTARVVSINNNVDLWLKKTTGSKSPEDGLDQGTSGLIRPMPLAQLVHQEIKDKENNKERDLFDFWNSKNIITHRKLTDKIKRKISITLKDYKPDEIKKAVLNYSTILLDDKYFWSHKWTLDEFLSRGIDRFLTDACFTNYLNKQQEQSKNTTQPTARGLNKTQYTQDELNYINNMEGYDV